MSGQIVEPPLEKPVERPVGLTNLLGMPLILTLAGLLYLSLAAGWPKFSRAEVFFAECAREMLAKHTLVTPLYHGHPFFDKPILMYWLVAGALHTFGCTHLAARIPSIIAALLTVVLVSVWTTFTFGRRSGIIAAMALSSSFMFLSFAALSMSDMFLVFFDSLAVVLLYQGLQVERNRTFLWWLAALAMGFAFLTKGPVGVVLPVMAFGCFLLWSNQLSVVRLQHILIGAVTIMVVSLPWFAAAYKENGWWAIAYFFVRENFQRFAAATYDTHKPVWFMFSSLMAGFAPWSIFLPFAAMRDWRDRANLEQLKTRNHKLFLWLWLSVVLVFFSLSRGKCDYYALPAYPAAAVLVGTYLSDLTAGQRFRWVYSACCGLFATVCIIGIIFADQALPNIGKMLVTQQVIPLIKQTPVTTRIGVFHTYAPGIDEITFQTGREPVRIDTQQQLAEYLSQAGAAMAIVPENEIMAKSATHHYQVVARMLSIVQPVTPGFILKRKGMLTDPVPLLVLAN